jgi:hypothetical protein
MFNKFFYQNKFVIETDTHKIYWTIVIYIKKNARLHITHKIYWIIIKKKQCKAAHMKNLIKKSILKKINLHKIKKQKPCQTQAP